MGKISRHRSGSIAEAKAKVRNIPRAEMLASWRPLAASVRVTWSDLSDCEVQGCRAAGLRRLWGKELSGKLLSHVLQQAHLFLEVELSVLWVRGGACKV